MDSLKLKPHEESFEVRPIGIRYRCEFCNEGEMIAKQDLKLIINASKMEGPPLIPHVCTKCGNTLLLPKSYPYIEYIPVERIEHIVHPKRYLIWPEWSVESLLKVIMKKEVEDNFFYKEIPQMTYKNNTRLFNKFEEIGLLTKNISNSFYSVAQWQYHEIPYDVIELFNQNGYDNTFIQDLLRKRDDQYVMGI